MDDLVDRLVLPALALNRSRGERDHNPPHFHAIYAEYEALIRIDSGAVIRGELPTTAMRLVEQWRALHEDELTANWASAQVPAALSTIEPLR